VEALEDALEFVFGDSAALVADLNLGFAGIGVA